MKKKPILFSTEMVKAILAGRKTQTRRVVKNKCNVYNDRETCTHLEEDIWKWLSETGHGSGIRYDQCFKCPYGQVGDVLWVKETFYAYGHWDRNGKTKTGKQKWKFVRDKKADIKFEWKADTLNVLRKNSYRGLGWYKRSALFMECDMARIWLRINNVRVERLQDISEEDAKSEGIKYLGADLEFGGVEYPGDWFKNYGSNGYCFLSAQDSFRSLWQSINGNQSWEDNPWVWVIEFERIF